MDFQENRNGTGAVSIIARITIAILLVITDIFMGALLIALYACIIALAAAALSCVYLGIVLIMDITVAWFSMPIVIPYISTILLGVALIALAILIVIGAEYCRLYVTQILRSFAQWHRNMLSKRKHAPPPLPLHPWIGTIKRRVMREGALVMFLILVIALIVCFCSMVIEARSLVPWHVWNWFD